MKKLIITSLLLAISSFAAAESVETTAQFRNMMKREYNITVPKTLVAGKKAAQICSGVDAQACNKLNNICSQSRSKGCRDFIKTQEALAAQEYDQ